MAKQAAYFSRKGMRQRNDQGLFTVYNDPLQETSVFYINLYEV